MKVWIDSEGCDDGIFTVYYRFLSFVYHTGFWTEYKVPKSWPTLVINHKRHRHTNQWGSFQLLRHQSQSTNSEKALGSNTNIWFF